MPPEQLNLPAQEPAQCTSSVYQLRTGRPTLASIYCRPTLASIYAWPTLASIYASPELVHRHPVPIKFLFRGKVVSKRGLCGTGLSLGAWGQLRFLALCPPPVQYSLGPRLFIRSAAPRADRRASDHGMLLAPCHAAHAVRPMRCGSWRSRGTGKPGHTSSIL
eukprot:SAG31_NODE_7684_length_1615_cov_4.183136_1_plen_163_part_00